MAADNTIFVGTGQAGDFSSLDHASLRVDPSITNQIHAEEPNQAPFLRLLERLPAKHVTQRVHDVQTSQELEFTTLVDGAVVSTTEETVVFDDTSLMAEWDMLLNVTTREQLMVLSVTNGTTAECKRGVNSTAVNIGDDDQIVLLAIAREEGAAKGNLRFKNTASHTTWTQEVEYVTGLTTAAMAQAVRGAPQESLLVAQAISSHQRMSERALLFSQGGSLTPDADTNNLPFFTMEGLREIATANNDAAVGGAMTWEELVAGIQTPSRFGRTRKRVGFTSQTIMTLLSQMPELRDSFRTPKTSTLGFELLHITGPGVDLTLIESFAMEDATITDEIIIADMGELALIEFLPTKVMRNIQDNGSQRKEWSIIRNFGLECTNLRTTGIISGITSVE